MKINYYMLVRSGLWPSQDDKIKFYPPSAIFNRKKLVVPQKLYQKNHPRKELVSHNFKNSNGKGLLIFLRINLIKLYTSIFQIFIFSEKKSVKSLGVNSKKLKMGWNWELKIGSGHYTLNQKQHIMLTGTKFQQGNFLPS